MRGHRLPSDAPKVAAREIGSLKRRGSADRQAEWDRYEPYRGYPARLSSPPSPDSATVTRSRAPRDTQYVGIAELSANGSSYIRARRSSGTRSSLSIRWT